MANPPINNLERFDFVIRFSIHCFHFSYVYGDKALHLVRLHRRRNHSLVGVDWIQEEEGLWSIKTKLQYVIIYRK